MNGLFNDVTDEMRNIFKNTYKQGDEHSLNSALKKLKENGYSQMQSLRILMVELNLGIKDADNLILNSEAWFPEKANNLQFRCDFERYLRDL